MDSSSQLNSLRVVEKLLLAHQRVRSILPDLERLHNSSSTQEWEDAVMSLFRIQTSALYEQLTTDYRHSPKNVAMLRGLGTDLNLLKIQVLEVLDGDLLAAKKLAVNLQVRLQLEEEYLIPLLHGVVHNQSKQS